MEITKVYHLDAVFDCPKDVPDDIKANRRYSGSSYCTVKKVAETVKQNFGTVDILVHSPANGPEILHGPRAQVDGHQGEVLIFLHLRCMWDPTSAPCSWRQVGHVGFIQTALSYPMPLSSTSITHILFCSHILIQV